MVNGGQASIAISNTSPNLFTVPGDRIIAVNSLDGALTNNEQTASGGVVVYCHQQYQPESVYRSR
ncbi:TraK domain-containing protein [Escherichia coli]|uniref:TraK domain-containing protein n=1 Tax=Escherichia coli TaxID=562 RepID=UPI003DA1A72A